MRIVIDARMYGWPGVGRYTQHLLSELEKIDTVHSYLVLLRKQDYRDYQPKKKNFQKVVADFAPYSRGEQIGLLKLVKSLNADLVHFLGPNQPIRYRKLHISTIYDLTLLKYKNVRGNRLGYEVKYRVFRYIFRRVVNTSQAVITISVSAKNELIEKYHVRQDKVNAILLGSETLTAKPAPVKNLPPTYLLYVGYAYPHKNLERLLQAFKLVRQQRPDLKLVLAGKDNFFYQRLKKKAIDLGLADAVFFTGYVNDGELVTLYKQAQALVFPSLSEGFGLPPLEAMGLGTPVITSNVSSMPEVCGDAAVYFDPHQPANMAAVILRTLADAKLIQTLRAKGYERVKKFSWRHTAEQTLAIYQRILNERRT